MICSQQVFLKLLAGFLTLGAIAAAADSPSAGREIIKADSDWKFSIGEVPGAAKPDFDDAAWRTLNCARLEH